MNSSELPNKTAKSESGTTAESLTKGSVWATILLLVFFLGCASKRVHGPEPRPPVTAPPTTPATPPNATPVSPPPPVTEQPAVPPPTATVERPHVGLVLGGAGVASFATVGLLKRFHEEGIPIDFIVVTGWPALFGLGYGFMHSVHDLEWFAMRLGERDFESSGFFEVNKDYAAHHKLSPLIQRSFPQADLSQSRIPVLLAPNNNEPPDREIYDHGDWRGPLAKTLAFPGLFSPFPRGFNAGTISQLEALDVDEAQRRGSKLIVSVAMYGDYLRQLKTESGDRQYRQAYARQLQKSLEHQLSSAQVAGKITLGKPPGDFSAKRAAILAGYREAIRLIKVVRQHAAGSF